MAKMKVNDFVAKADKIRASKTLYKLGTFGNKNNGKGYTYYDCCGIIKGILWGYPESGKYKANSIPDQNDSMMINSCTSVSTNFKSISKGELVWLQGHIGIYIGGGVVVESTPIWSNGVQKTYCKGSGYTNSQNLHERKWTKHGKYKYIDYSKEESKPVATKKSITEIAKEVIAGKWGNGDSRKKKLKEAGYDYNEVQKKVNELLK